MISADGDRPFFSMEEYDGDALRKDEICFFGFGELLRTCFEELVNLCGRKPSFIFDNNPVLDGTTFSGVPIKSIESLKNKHTSVTVIITIIEYEPIIQQLSAIGIGKIFVANFERSYFRIKSIKRFNGYELDSAKPDELLLKEKLSGRLAMITGAGGGLGSELAKCFAAFAMNLLLVGRDVNALYRTRDCCLEHSVEVTIIPVDLADSVAVERLGGSFGKALPLVDVLVNNAAISPPAELSYFPYASTDLYERCFRVNALAPIILSNHLLPKMLERGAGKVINISSSISSKPSAIHYACSKAMLDKYVFDIYKTLAGSGVSISLTDPGWLRTPMTGFHGRHEVESAINGVLLQVLLDLNGQWISAQEFAGMSLADALAKAKQKYTLAEPARVKVVVP